MRYPYIVVVMMVMVMVMTLPLLAPPLSNTNLIFVTEIHLRPSPRPVCNRHLSIACISCNRPKPQLIKPPRDSPTAP